MPLFDIDIRDGNLTILQELGPKKFPSIGHAGAHAYNLILERVKRSNEPMLVSVELAGDSDVREHFWVMPKHDPDYGHIRNVCWASAVEGPPEDFE